MLDLEPIKARLAAATPGPWSSCDKCKCTSIACSGYPVANVVKGKWGDEFPAVRLTGTGPLTATAEAYMEMYEYGEVPEEEAMGNRAFIREAPTDVAALVAEVERLRAALGE